ncbi:MAG TPA: hypothetical protein PKM27_14995 [Saprospiraceae bacterium]|nr:hypothetical protein [Saprospiraceae bacterium]
MHFQEIKDEYYLKINKRLRETNPQFKSVFDIDDGVYLILGEFGTYLLDHINEDDKFSDALCFINEALEYGKHETEDAIVIQIFHKIYASSIDISKFRDYLNPRAKFVFDTQLTKFNEPI